jgi:hypothetical protein
MDDVSLVEQEFCEVCTILTRDASNQSHAFCHGCSVPDPVRFSVFAATVISLLYTRTEDSRWIVSEILKSAANLLAWELAHQLENLGREIEFVVLVRRARSMQGDRFVSLPALQDSSLQSPEGRLAKSSNATRCVPSGVESSGRSITVRFCA